MMWMSKGYCELCEKTYEEQIEKLSKENEKLRAMVPLKEQLKQCTYTELIRIAQKDYGMTSQYILDSCDHKAELIHEILIAKRKLDEI